MVIFSSGLERVFIGRRFLSVSENHGSVLVNLPISSKKKSGTQKAAVLLGSAFCPVCRVHPCPEQGQSSQRVEESKSYDYCYCDVQEVQIRAAQESYVGEVKSTGS